MNRKRIVTATALFFFANSTLALAEESPATDAPQAAKSFKELYGKGPQEQDFYRTDRLLVTATGSQKPMHLAPSVASVITADDIEKMGATTLDEVLESVCGLHVSQHRARIGAGLKKLTTLPYESKNFGPGVLNGTSFKPVKLEPSMTR